jgi:hypothetical protein
MRKQGKLSPVDKDRAQISTTQRGNDVVCEYQFSIRNPSMFKG